MPITIEKKKERKESSLFQQTAKKNLFPLKHTSGVPTFAKTASDK